MKIEKFASIFDGLKEAYGYFKIEKTGSNGKAQGKAGVTRTTDPRALEKPLAW